MLSRRKGLAYWGYCRGVGGLFVTGGGVRGWLVVDPGGLTAGGSCRVAVRERMRLWSKFVGVLGDLCVWYICWRCG